MEPAKVNKMIYLFFTGNQFLSTRDIQVEISASSVPLNYYLEVQIEARAAERKKTNTMNIFTELCRYSAIQIRAVGKEKNQGLGHNSIRKTIQVIS